MSHQRHSLVREGLLTGLIGGVVLALWYLVFDVAAGQPFHMAGVLARFLFRGDFTAGQAGVTPGITLVSMAFYAVWFALTGLALTQLAHLAGRNRSLRMGVWLALVVGFGLYTTVTIVLLASVGETLNVGRVVAGNLLSLAAMAGFLLRSHPLITSTADPLGGEGRAPSHPPG